MVVQCAVKKVLQINLLFHTCHLSIKQAYYFLLKKIILLMAVWLWLYGWPVMLHVGYLLIGALVVLYGNCLTFKRFNICSRHQKPRDVKPIGFKITLDLTHILDLWIWNLWRNVKHSDAILFVSIYYLCFAVHAMWCSWARVTGGTEPSSPLDWSETPSTAAPIPGEQICCVCLARSVGEE